MIGHPLSTRFVHAAGPSAMAIAGSFSKASPNDAPNKEVANATRQRDKESSSSPVHAHGIGLGEQDGIVPRAVQDIFTFARDGVAGMTATPASGKWVSRSPSSQNSCETPSAGGARTMSNATCTSGPATSSRSTTGSNNRPISADDPAAHVPSAAQWPLSELSGYKVPAQTCEELLGEHTPYQSERPSTVGNEIGSLIGSEDDKGSTREGVSYSVACSYMQVINAESTNAVQVHTWQYVQNMRLARCRSNRA